MRGCWAGSSRAFRSLSTSSQKVGNVASFVVLVLWGSAAALWAEAEISTTIPNVPCEPYRRGGDHAHRSLCRRRFVSSGQPSRSDNQRGAPASERIRGCHFGNRGNNGDLIECAIVALLVDAPDLVLTNTVAMAVDLGGSPHAKSFRATIDGAQCGATSKAHIAGTATVGGTLRSDIDLGTQNTAVSVRVSISAGDLQSASQTVTPGASAPVQVSIGPGLVAIDIESVSHDDFECGNREIAIALVDPRIV